MGEKNQPLFQKVDCVMLHVPDLDQALTFYQDRLGHRLIWRIADAAGLQMPGTDAEIVLQAGPKQVDVDFLVQSANVAVDEFVKAGGTVVVAPFDIQIGRAVKVRDPWGNELVLLDMSKGRLITDEQGKIIGNEPPG